MTHFRYSDQITCAYLYPISKYGYPPDPKQTKHYIAEMVGLGFKSIELEGIGFGNIEYLHSKRDELADAIKDLNCVVPVYCVVLPQLGAADPVQQAQCLEFFEMGCETAKALGANGVLDNGPLLPLEYPANLPVMRHYTEEELKTPGLPEGFNWLRYEENLIDTYRKACTIAAKYQLDYHLHPCEGSLITSTDSVVYFSEAVNCENLLFNLDTANQFYRKDNLALSVHRLAHKIKYIHISDNSGTRMEHLVPGEGRIHWKHFFEALQQVGFKGHLAIDVGGEETGIKDLNEAYHRSAEWLEEKISQYLLPNN